MPVTAVLNPLDTNALKLILTEPRDAIVKQFRTLLSMDNVDLKFDKKAVEAIANEAFRRKTGARALRGIVEELMLDLMYNLPSQKDVQNFIITEEMVNDCSSGNIVKLELKESKIQKQESA